MCTVYVLPKLPMLSVAGAQENSEQICNSFSCSSSPFPSLSAMGSNTDPNEPYDIGLLVLFFSCIHTHTVALTLFQFRCNNTFYCFGMGVNIVSILSPFFPSVSQIKITNSNSSFCDVLDPKNIKNYVIMYVLYIATVAWNEEAKPIHCYKVDRFS